VPEVPFRVRHGGTQRPGGHSLAIGCMNTAAGRDGTGWQSLAMRPASQYTSNQLES
jgi:hypothetical protein